MNIPSTSEQSEHSKYDYTIFLNSAKKESEYECFTSFISEKIAKCREDHYDNNVHLFNRAVLAKMIGMETSTLTRIINGGQPTRKRDVIIALCFALRLTTSEANLALNLYPMAPLNPNNMRDLVIIHALNDGVAVKKVNGILNYHGFSELNILRGNKKSDDRSFYYPASSSSFEEVSVEVTPYCIAGDGILLSLNFKYDPEIYYYYSTMVIKKKDDNGMKYRITYEDDDEYVVEKEADGGWKYLYSDSHIKQWYHDVTECEDPDLKMEIEKLKKYTEDRARYVYNMCSDTMYYKHRLNAVNNNGELEIYGELFNSDRPELQEYFQIELTSTRCLLTMSNGSRFLAKYLGDADWIRMYGVPVPPVTNSFESLEKVSNNEWLAQFQALLEQARELISQIRDRKIFLVNAYGLYNDVDDIMLKYNVSKDFDCYGTEESPVIPHKDFIIGSDGKPITVDDLYLAAELDIKSVEELCDIRSRYGSLDGFLNLNLP